MPDTTPLALREKRERALRYASEIAHRFHRLEGLTKAVNDAMDTDYSANGLRNAFKRKEGKPLSYLLGREPASDFVDEATRPGVFEAPAIAEDDEPDGPEVQLPSGQRPSQLPPDHIIRAEPPTSGYVVLTSDHHYPIHDKTAEGAVLALVRDIKPKVWVGNGDLIDAWWISRHDKEAERLVDRDSGVRIIDEVNSFRPFMAEMARIVERGYIGMGNHENRLGALINANPGLHGLPGLRWQSIFDPPPNVQVMDYGYRMQLGPVSMVHGDRLGGRMFGLKHPTAWALDNQGARSVIFGHTHRMATTFRTTWEDTGPRQVVAINQGHLSDVSKQHYVVEPNWQQGIVILDFWTEAGRPRYTPHLIPIIGGVLRFAGKTYRG